MHMPCLLEQLIKRTKKEILFFYSWTLIKFNGNIVLNETEFGLDFKLTPQFSSLIVLVKCLSTTGTLEN